MELLVVIFYVLVFSVIISKVPFFRRVSGLSIRWLLIFFVLKVISGAILVFIYTYYYTEPEFADIYNYFNDGRVIFSALPNSVPDYLRMVTGIDSGAPHLDKYYSQMGHWVRPWDPVLYNDNRLIIRFNALVSLFSLGYIQVHSVFMNFLSFSGLVALLGFFRKYSDPEKLQWLAPGLFLIPGLLFWGSGVLKEALLLWAFGFWNYYLSRLTGSPRKQWPFLIVLFLAFTWVLVLLKPYTFYLWLPCILAFYLWKNAGALNFNIRMIALLTGLVIAAWLTGKMFPQFDLLTIIATKQNDFIAQSLYHDAGSIIYTHLLRPTIVEFARAFPSGVLHTLTRPHLFEANSTVTLMAALENLLLVAMILYGLVSYKKKQMNDYPLKWAAIWFVILLFGLVGMVTVASGGMVRYRIPAMPFLWFFIVHMAHLPKLKLPFFPDVSSTGQKRPLNSKNRK